MIINKIIGKECKTTRSLWEEVFYEDSVQFTDYYFNNKAEKNIGYVIRQAPYDAMMFRTPYTVRIGQIQKELSYIVGVATRKECRHRGYMRRLLLHSFKEMYEKKEPFAFLMPANPAIYEPFDFCYIYERQQWKVIEDELDKKIDSWEAGDKPTGLYSVKSLREQGTEFPIMEKLAEFANEYLKEHYNIYVYRDLEYYEMQLKESIAQNGDIYVLLDQGDVKAFFLYAKEDGEVFIQEVMEVEEGCLQFLQKEKNKKPIIMARIIHLEEMLKLVCSKENKKIILEIEDNLICENAGIYLWEITSEGSSVSKLLDESSLEELVNTNENWKEAERYFMHIRELAPRILTGVFINEIV